MNQPATPNSLIEGLRAAFEATESKDDLARAWGFGDAAESYANPAVQNRWVGWQRAILADRAQRPSSVAGTGTLNDLVMPPVAAPVSQHDASGLVRAGWFLYEGTAWLPTSSDDPRATILYRKAVAGQPVPGAGRNAQPDQPDSSSLAPTVAAPDERAAFEATEAAEDLERAWAFGSVVDDYANPAVQNRWIGWQRARLAPAAPSGEAVAVGEAAVMPGTSGFTMACFKATDVPLGTKLYTHPATSSQSGEVLRDVAWELHQAGFPENESPEVRLVFSSRMADEYIEEGWKLARVLKSDKRTESFARGYDQAVEFPAPSSPTAPGQQAQAVPEGVTDAARDVLAERRRQVCKHTRGEVTMNKIATLLREVAANPKADAISYLKARMVEAADEIDRLSRPAAPVVAEGLIMPIEPPIELLKKMHLMYWRDHGRTEELVMSWHEGSEPLWRKTYAAMVEYLAAHPVAGSPAEAGMTVQDALKIALRDLAALAPEELRAELDSHKGKLRLEYPAAAAPMPAGADLAQITKERDEWRALAKEQIAKVSELTGTMGSMVIERLGGKPMPASEAGDILGRAAELGFISPAAPVPASEAAKDVKRLVDSWVYAFNVPLSGPAYDSLREAIRTIAAPAAPTDAKPYDDTTLEAAAKECDHWQQIGAPSHKCGEQMAHVIRGMKSDTAAQSVRDAAQPTIAVEEVRDAARYRQLRNVADEFVGEKGYPVIALPITHNTGHYATKEDADAAIDAALASTTTPKEGL